MLRLLDKLRILLNNYARARIIIPLIIITTATYTYMLMFSIPSVMEYSGGMKIFDMLATGYTYDYARLLLTNLGEEGRRVYLTYQIPIDMVYPIFFAVTYTLLLLFIFRSGFKSTSPIHRLIFIPVFAGFFDYLENIGIIIMLRSYPDFSPAWVNITGIFSMAKAAFTTIFWLLLLIGLAAITKRRLRRN